jgi:chitodextrinase
MVMLAVNCWTFLFSDMLRKRAVELSMQANTLGDWTRCHSVRPNVEEWNPEKSYNHGEIVTYKGNTYKAVGISNN